MCRKQKQRGSVDAPTKQKKIKAISINIIEKTEKNPAVKFRTVCVGRINQVFLNPVTEYLV